MSFVDLSSPWPMRAANRWGHWGSHFMIGAILASIMLVLKPIPPANPLSVILPVSLFMMVIGSWVLMRQHDRRLCENCMASMPLDAAAQATRYRRRFAVTHLGARRSIVITYLTVLLGSNILLIEPSLLGASVGRWVWAAVQSTMIYLVRSYSTHRKLQPWCPQCSGGDGGGTDVDAPDPVPTGSQTA